MNIEYQWWNLEKSNFKQILYNTIGNFYLHDHPYTTWEEFEEDLPHMAFTHLVFTRFEMLERLFVDLRVVIQMLGATDVPVRSNEMNINRYDWLKSALDLKLLRFSSIRDVSFHFVNEILGIGIDERKVNLNNIKKILSKSRPELMDLLDTISTAGVEIRKERNIRAHAGFANLGTEDDQMFCNMSWAECNGVTSMNYDLVGIYNEVVERMHDRLVAETSDLLAVVICLVDELIPDFESMYVQKRLTKKRRQCG